MVRLKVLELRTTEKVIILILLNTVWISHSQTVGPTNLLNALSSVEISASDINGTWCCYGVAVGNCTTGLKSPSCAYDGNTTTRWVLRPNQLKATLTLNLNSPSIVDNFRLTLDPSGAIPSSIQVDLINSAGSNVTWRTWINNTCLPSDSYLRRIDSIYFSCLKSNAAIMMSPPVGLFSIKNGSNGWLWWQPFNQVRLTIDAEFISSGNGQIGVADLQIYGWNAPTNACNCHPAGVLDSKNPCNPSGTCQCRYTDYSGSQCLPRLDLMLPNYGPLHGGTVIVTTGNFLAKLTSVTIGSGYNCTISKKNDTRIISTTPPGLSNDLGLPLPLQIYFEEPKGVRSFIIAANWEFKPNPIIERIYPKISIVRGGITQTVIGRNLDSVAYPFINIVLLFSSALVYAYNNTYSKAPLFQNQADYFCQTIDSTVLHCLSPTLGNIQIPQYDEIFIGIALDGNQYNNYSECRVNDSQCNFILAPDPVITEWNPETRIYPTYDGLKPIEIYGSGFQFPIKLDNEYRVTVGGIECQIIDLLNNVIYFQPPNASQLQDSTKPQQTNLYIGSYYSLTAGELQYRDKDWDKINAIIGGVIGGVGGLALLAVIIALIVFCCRRQKEKRALLRSSPHSLERGEDQHFLNHLSEDVQERISKFIVPYNRINFDAVLGKGNFGKVYKGTFENKDGVKQPVAIKTLIDDSYLNYKEKAEFFQEAMLMADFCHKNVLSLIAVCIERDTPFVVLPFMEHGDLKGFVTKESKEFSAGDLVMICLQVAEGMEYLAGRNFVHRDLAARNCVINKDMLVKVADFGLARDIFEKDYYKVNHSRPLPVKWMAIECLSDNQTFTEKSDVWSYGVLTWEILSRGNRPYNDVDNLDMQRFLKEGRRLSKPSYAPDFMYDLMIRCWLPDPKDRPRFKDIVEELKSILALANDENPHRSQSEMSVDADVREQSRKSYLQVMHLSVHSLY